MNKLHTYYIKFFAQRIKSLFFWCLIMLCKKKTYFWSGLPFPSPGDLPDPGIEPSPPALQTDASTSEPPGKPHFFIFG